MHVLRILAIVIPGIFALHSVFANPPTIVADQTSIGTSVTLDQNTYRITDGTRRGVNLFHSFSRFDVDTGYIADFVNPNSGTIENILSRITSPGASNIDGLLRSSIPGANLFFINPNGIIFGENASIDIQGSVYFSTANDIRFNDALSIFSADPNNSILEQASLDVAHPEAFGFLAENTAQLQINESELLISPEQEFGLVSNSITIVGGQFFADSASIKLISTTGVNPVPLDHIPVESLIGFGQIEISDGTFFELSGDDTGKIQITGDQITMEDSDVFSENGNIHLSGGDVVVTGSAIINESTNFHQISISGQSITLDFSDIVGGALTFDATLVMNADSSFIETTGAGDENGDISIVTGSLDFVDTAVLNLESGDIDIFAEDNVILDQGSNLTTTSFSGDSGTVNIVAKNLRLDNGSEISNETLMGASGTTRLDIQNAVTITNQSRITNRALEDQTAGRLVIHSTSLTLSNDGVINGNTVSGGQGADVEIITSGPVVLDGKGTIISTTSESAATGRGGNISISSRSLVVQNSAKISASTEGVGGGGNVLIDTENTILKNKGSISTSSSAQNLDLNADPDSGRAGTIIINADDTLRLEGQGLVTAETVEANAGDITITARNLLSLQDKSSISTSVANGQSAGGNIFIDPIFVILDGTSTIQANAAEGSGGTINIQTDFFLGPRSNVTANANGPGGIDGTVEIDAPDSNIIPETILLPGALLNAAALLDTACSAEYLANASRLAVVNQRGIPPEPNRVLSHHYASFQNDSAATAAKINQSSQAKARAAFVNLVEWTNEKDRSKNSNRFPCKRAP